MPATVAKLRGALISDLGPLLNVAEISLIPDENGSTGLDGPIGEAVLSNGGTLADPPAVTDDDIATVTTSWRRFMQFIRLYVLEKIWGNWPHVDMKAGEESQSLNQLAVRLQKRMEEIKAELADPESIENASVAEGPPTVGLISAGRCIPDNILPDRTWTCFRPFM